VHSCNQKITLTRTHTTQLHCNPLYLTEITQLLTTNIHLNSPPMCKHYQGQSHSRSQYHYGDKASTHSPTLEVTERVERGLWRQRSKKAIFPCHTRTRETITLQRRINRSPWTRISLSSYNKCGLFLFVAVYLSGNKRASNESSNDI